jgi:hypothetical protein
MQASSMCTHTHTHTQKQLCAGSTLTVNNLGVALDSTVFTKEGADCDAVMLPMVAVQLTLSLAGQGSRGCP